MLNGNFIIYIFFLITYSSGKLFFPNDNLTSEIIYTYKEIINNTFIFITSTEPQTKSNLF